MGELVYVDLLKVFNTLRFKLYTCARPSYQLIDCFDYIKLFTEQFKEAHVVTIRQEKCFFIKHVNYHLSLIIDRATVKSFRLREI